MKKLLSVFIGMLAVPFAAHALTADELIPTFTSNQASALEQYVTQYTDTADAYLDGTSSVTLKIGGTTYAGLNSSGRLYTGGDIPTSDLFTAQFLVRANPNNANAITTLASTNDAAGTSLALAKTRNTSGTGDTIVQNGDTVATIAFQAADGATFRTGASIVASVAAAPGSSDMPMKIVFNTAPDGSATPAAVLTLDQDKSATFTGTITSSRTSDLGWSVATGANTACTTTCTSAAVLGFDSGTTTFVGPSSALADVCLCAGAS